LFPELSGYALPYQAEAISGNFAILKIRYRLKMGLRLTEQDLVRDGRLKDAQQEYSDGQREQVHDLLLRATLVRVDLNCLANDVKHAIEQGMTESKQYAILEEKMSASFKQ
jgi:hypothetical protein